LKDQPPDVGIRSIGHASIDIKWWKEFWKILWLSVTEPGVFNVRATTGRELLSLYRDLREKKGYDLPAVRSQAEAEVAMEEWENIKYGQA